MNKITYPGIIHLILGVRMNWLDRARPRPSTAVFEVRNQLRRLNENMALPMTEHDRLEVLISYELGILAMTMGYGSEDSMDFIVTALNVALVLAEMGHCPDMLATIERAQQGAFIAATRGLKTGRWAFNGPDIQPVRDAIGAHGEQLKTASKRDIGGALEVIRYRINNGIAFTTEPA